MYKFFGNILNTFNSWTGNYMLALLLFALLVKIIMLPLAVIQQKNQIKGAKLRPKMMVIEKKYAGRTDRVTQQKKQQEMMDLQQKEGYSPLSGCLPLLIQFPIIIILYRVIQKPLTYVSKFSGELLEAFKTTLEGLGETVGSYSSSEIEFVSLIRNHAAELQADFEAAGKAGSLLDALPKMEFFGADLCVKPYFWSILLLIPVLNFAFGVLTMKLSKKLNGNTAAMTADTPDAKVSNGIMEWMMPVMSLWFAFILPSALGLYWIFQSVIGIVQMLILAKVMPMPKFTKEEMEAIIKEAKKKQNERPAYAGGSVTPNGIRSLHHIDDDDDFPDEPPKKQQNGGNKQRKHAPVSTNPDRKLRPEDFEKSKETEEAEEVGEAETVEEAPETAVNDETVTADLTDLVNQIGADTENGQNEDASSDKE